MKLHVVLFIVGAVLVLETLGDTVAPSESPVIGGESGSPEVSHQTTRHPHVSRQPRTRHPHVSRQPGTRHPHVSRQPGTGRPLFSRPPGTGRPLYSRPPGTGRPLFSRQPRTGAPFVSREPRTRRPTLPPRTRLPPPTRVPLTKCATAEDCSAGECCVTQTILPFKRGVCLSLGSEGRHCTTEEDAVLSNGMYYRHCPCATGLECVAESIKVIPNIGEVKINERCTTGSTTVEE
ncbi:uncharacterized protein LOC129216122 [Uloborus diversus]|uniref:uncharacterized protein LOC129216122 n=1 Tax=Uloborus diversus TaxID=327109 RepID=UPI00240A6626|nr:uncharacterized protein LOC129216122 [Uloborus diversus]